MKKWLICGDTHGDFSWLNNDEFEDYVRDQTCFLILGDAGINFFSNERDIKLKEEIMNSGFYVYCVRGNHDVRPQDVAGMDIMYDHEVGGEVYWEPEYPNIRYFKDYGIYTINGYKCAVIGGAYSVDKWFRLLDAGIKSNSDPRYFNSKVSGWCWNEQLSEKEMREAEDMLSGTTVEFVFSHTCPFSWRPVDLFLGIVNQGSVDTSMELWMEELKEKFNWHIWLYGHYHADRLERPHCELFYNMREPLENIKERWDEYDETGHIDWWLPKGPYFYDN